VSEDPRRDVWLDLVAFVAAMRQHDEEGLRAVLDANLDCRWCMESLLRAAGFLLIRVLEDPRRVVLTRLWPRFAGLCWSSSDLPLTRGTLGRASGGQPAGAPRLPDADPAPRRLSVLLRGRRICLEDGSPQRWRSTPVTLTAPWTPLGPAGTRTGRLRTGRSRTRSATSG
jgi:hypothetical protein